MQNLVAQLALHNYTVELLDSSMLWQMVSRIATFCLIMVSSRVWFN